MLVSAQKAAEELGLSIATVRGKIRDGEWPVYQLGAKSTRLDLDEIKKITRRAGEKRPRRVINPSGDNA